MAIDLQMPRATAVRVSNMYRSIHVSQQGVCTARLALGVCACVCVCDEYVHPYTYPIHIHPHMDLQEAFLVQTCASCDGVDGRQQAVQGFASRRQQADQTIRLCARISSLKHRQ